MCVDKIEKIFEITSKNERNITKWINTNIETETKLLKEKKTEAQKELKLVKAEISVPTNLKVQPPMRQLPLRAVWVLFSEVENKIVRMQERGFARPNTLTWRWSPTTKMVTAQQIQEIKHAYEQQYRKLSEFTDFIGRYSSYVEKQTSLINFLRDWLGSMTK